MDKKLKRRGCIGIFFGISAFFLPQGACKAAQLGGAPMDVYPPGEKPGLSTPLQGKNVISFDLPRGGSGFFTIRFSGRKPNVEVNGAIEGLTVDWENKSPAPPLELKSYRIGAQKLRFSPLPEAGETPDLLIPNEMIGSHTAVLPESQQSSKTDFLIDIHVPQKTPSGEYSGLLRVTHGAKKYALRLNCTVHDFSLPRKLAMTASFGFEPWEMMLKHFGKWDSRGIALGRLYQALAIENRVTLHKVYWKFPPLDAPDPLQDPVEGQSFLSLTAPLPDQPLFNATDLPVAPEAKVLTANDKQNAKIQAFWRHLNASVLHHGLKGDTFVYFSDEPKAPEISAIAKDLKQIEKWAPDLRFLMTTGYRSELDQLVQIWCVDLSLWQRGGKDDESFYRARLTKHKSEELWFYVSCDSHGCNSPENPGDADLAMDRPASYARAFPWIALRFGAKGILYYDTVYGYRHGPAASPWQDAFNFKGYGEGNLFYPCTKDWGGCIEPRIFLSIRLKILRDGLEDAEILREAQARGAPVQQWLKALIPDSRSFPKRISDYNEIRKRALLFLDRSLRST